MGFFPRHGGEWNPRLRGAAARLARGFCRHRLRSDGGEGAKSIGLLAAVRGEPRLSARRAATAHHRGHDRGHQSPRRRFLDRAHPRLGQTVRQRARRDRSAGRGDGSGGGRREPGGRRVRAPDAQPGGVLRRVPAGRGAALPGPGGRRADGRGARRVRGERVRRGFPRPGPGRRPLRTDTAPTAGPGQRRGRLRGQGRRPPGRAARGDGGDGGRTRTGAVGRRGRVLRHRESRGLRREWRELDRAGRGAGRRPNRPVHQGR